MYYMYRNVNHNVILKQHDYICSNYVSNAAKKSLLNAVVQDNEK